MTPLAIPVYGLVSIGGVTVGLSLSPGTSPAGAPATRSASPQGRASAPATAAVPVVRRTGHPLCRRHRRLELVGHQPDRRHRPRLRPRSDHPDRHPRLVPGPRPGRALAVIIITVVIVAVGSERGLRWDFVRQVLAGIALGIASSIAGVVGFLGVLGWRLRDGADVKPRASDEPSRSTLVVVGSVTTWRIIVAFPEVAYTVAGILGTVAWLKGRAWLAGRQDNAAEDQEEVEPPDIGASLRRLVGDDKGGPPHSTPAVPVAAMPAAPSLVAPDCHDDRCCCMSDDNSNGNNGSDEGAGEGARAETVDEGGRIVPGAPTTAPSSW